MVHILPSRQNDTAENIAELMFDSVYKHHGLPKNIISDCDSIFTSQFWTWLHELVGTKLRMSSAYHPQSDGSTERCPVPIILRVMGPPSGPTAPSHKCCGSVLMTNKPTG